MRFLVIETRRVASHDAAAELPDIPDIFVPVSTSGMAQAVWHATCPPMRAMGTMFDAGYYALEDIDRIDELRAIVDEEEKSKASTR